MQFHDATPSVYFQSCIFTIRVITFAIFHQSSLEFVWSETSNQCTPPKRYIIFIKMCILLSLRILDADKCSPITFCKQRNCLPGPPQIGIYVLVIGRASLTRFIENHFDMVLSGNKANNYDILRAMSVCYSTREFSYQRTTVSDNIKIKIMGLNDLKEQLIIAFLNFLDRDDTVSF